MAKLFVDLVSANLLNDWASLLDWFFDDNKFHQWSSSKVGKLTKKIKRLPGLGKTTYTYDCAKRLSFPKYPSHHTIKVQLGRKDSEAKDWIRHLRNGIAHGKTRTIKRNNELWIEIEDYSKSGNQTAYLFMPIDYMVRIYRFYAEVNRQK